MKIKTLYIKNFGHFENKDIYLEDGINIIHGNNEAGKSTIIAFIRGMLFGIERPRGRISKDNLYAKYYPWNYRGQYGGIMDLEYKGIDYRIYRNFSKDIKDYKVIQLANGREIPVVDKNGLSFMEELTEDRYRNTIGVEQLKVGTSNSLAQEVQSYIQNLTTARTCTINVGKAIGNLKAQKKELDKEDLDNKIKETYTMLAKCEELEYTCAAVEKDIVELEGKKSSIELQMNNSDIKKLESYIEKYEDIKELYRCYTIECVPQKSVKKPFNVFNIILGVIAIVSVILAIKVNPLIYIISISVVLFIIARLYMQKDRVKYSESKELYSKEIINYASRMFDFSNVDEENMNKLQCEIYTLQETIKKKKENLFRNYQEVCLEMANLQLKREQLLEHEDNVDEIKKNQEELYKRKKEREDSKLAIDLAIDCITKSSMEIHNSFGSELNNHISEWVSKETNGKYKDVFVDEQLNIKLMNNGYLVELEKFSVGTIEQIYFSLRLAISDLLFSKEPMPILLDETFAFYDNERLESTLIQLAANERQQIVLFTCQGREEVILNNNNISYNKLEL